MPRPVRHLSGALVTALADGQLCPRSTERCLSHVAACPRCRDRVEGQRLARRAVASVEEIGPSQDFMVRLLAACPGRGDQASPAPLVPPGGARPDRRRSRRRAWTWSLTGAAAAGAVVVGGLFVIGGEPRDLVWADVTPAGTPPLAVVTRAALPAPTTGSSAPGEDLAGGGDATAQVLGWMRSEGWVVPEMVPTDVSVVDVSLEPDGSLMVVLEGADSRVVMTEHRGSLGADAAGLGEQIVLGHVTAQVVDTSPWTAVVESAGTVVTVVSHGSGRAGRQLVAALDAEPERPSAAARVARGWSTVVESIREATG